MPSVGRSFEVITFFTLFLLSIFTFDYNATAAVGKKENDDSLVSGQGLYNASDSVVILNATNFKSNVYGSNTGWLVEFYNSWCGFCYRFAPTWKALAHDVLPWRGIVVIAAIDCADDDNNPICREYEIMQYPMLKYFPVNAHPSFIGTIVDKADSLDILRHNLIDRLEREQEEGRGQMWPNITPYRNAETKDIWKAGGDAVKYFFFIFEKKDSDLGAAVILDMHKITTLQIRRVTSDNELLCLTNKITKFPSVVVFDRDGTQKTVSVRIPSREGVRNAIREFMHSKGLIDDQPSTGHSIDRSINTVKNAGHIMKTSTEYFHTTKDVLYRVDLDSTLRYAFYHEISLHKNIEGVQMAALKSFLNVLIDFYPVGRATTFLKVIRSYIAEKSSITGKKFKEIVKFAGKEAFQISSTSPEWIGCKGSSNVFRGYPCGLWTMFHMLTVNYALQDEEIVRYEPFSILQAIYGYVKHFFGCSDCSHHFIEMSERNNMRGVQTKDQNILWLWKAHNEVNARLAGDETEDPKHKKIQYPSIEHCSTCRLLNGSWSEEHVLNYLKLKYSHKAISYYGSDNRETEMIRNGVSSHGNTSIRKHGWDFTVFDISICVILYIASATILILVCIKFAVKRTYKKKVYVNLLGKV